MVRVRLFFAILFLSAGLSGAASGAVPVSDQDGPLSGDIASVEMKDSDIRAFVERIFVYRRAEARRGEPQNGPLAETLRMCRNTPEWSVSSCVRFHEKWSEPRRRIYLRYGKVLESRDVSVLQRIVSPATKDGSRTVLYLVRADEKLTLKKKNDSAMPESSYLQVRVVVDSQGRVRDLDVGKI